MGSRPILLHIGPPKTGTTSIQECLYHAELKGSLGRIRYPLLNDAHNHNQLKAVYRPYEELSARWHREYPRNDRRFQRMRRNYRRVLFDQLRSADGAILSAETIAGFAPPAAAELRRDLESLGFDEFHVVIYARDPAELYLSAVQQRLKTVYVPQNISEPGQYRSVLLRITNEWEQVFPGSLMVRRFSSSADRDVVDDFADIVQQCMGVVLPRIRKRMNSSLSAEAMLILQDYREAFWPNTDGLPTADVQSLVKFLERSASDVTQTKPLLKEDIAEHIRANHSGDAEQIFLRYGVDLGLRNFPRTEVPGTAAGIRVEDIVQSVDPAVVHQLLLLLSRAEAGRASAKRSPPLRLAAQVYRALPRQLRPEQVDAWLRSIVATGQL